MFTTKITAKPVSIPISKSVPYKPSNDSLGRDLGISRNIVPDYIEYLTKSGLFGALHEPGHSDNLLMQVEEAFKKK